MANSPFKTHIGGTPLFSQFLPPVFLALAKGATGLSGEGPMTCLTLSSCEFKSPHFLLQRHQCPHGRTATLMALSNVHSPGLEGLLQLVTAALITRLRAITLDDRIPQHRTSSCGGRASRARTLGPLCHLSALWASLFCSRLTPGPAEVLVD